MALHTIHTHKERKLTRTEKRIISFLDATPTHSRISTYEAMLDWRYDDTYVQLEYCDNVLSIHPFYLLSLAGKRLIKLHYGRVYLDISVPHRRSQAALRKMGYFDHVESRGAFKDD